MQKRDSLRMHLVLKIIILFSEYDHDDLSPGQGVSMKHLYWPLYTKKLTKLCPDNFLYLKNHTGIILCIRFFF